MKPCPQKAQCLAPSKCQSMLAVVVTSLVVATTPKFLLLLFLVTVQSALQEDFVPNNTKTTTF